MTPEYNAVVFAVLSNLYVLVNGAVLCAVSLWRGYIIKLCLVSVNIMLCWLIVQDAVLVVLLWYVILSCVCVTVLGLMFG